MVRQTERREATRTRILEAAEHLFGRAGYDATSTEAILEAAGISRGALYHHFETKQAVFEAVFERASEAAIERAASGAKPSPSPLESLVRICLRWLQEVRKPIVATLLIEDGPKVLGWKRARDLEANASLERMTRGLREAERAGEIEVESAELAARYLNAVLAEAALATIHRPSGTARVGAAAIERSIRQMFEGLAPRASEKKPPKV